MKNIKSDLHFKNKSQAHVEMIISFTIFLGALILIFAFINPVKEKEQDSSVEEIQRIILDRISENLGKLSVVLDSPDDCYEIPSYGNKFVEVRDSNRKYTLYYNLNENPGIQGCLSKTGRNYTFGAYSKENLIIYGKILGLKEDYDSDYAYLKNSLGINKEFLFNFREINGDVISEISALKNIPKGVEVYAKELPVRVIYNSGEIKELMMNLKVW